MNTTQWTDRARVEDETLDLAMKDRLRILLFSATFLGYEDHLDLCGLSVSIAHHIYGKYSPLAVDGDRVLPLVPNGRDEKHQHTDRTRKS